MQHPKCALAFALARDRNGRIFSFATFQALRRRRRRDYAFSFHHLAFRGGDTGDPLDEMRKLIPREALVIGEAPLGEGSRALDRAEQFIMTASPTADPAAPPRAPLILLRNCENRIQGLAEGYGIPLAALDDPLEQQVRRLADRAQALWITWAVTHVARRDQTIALAAFRAWRAIEDARPMPF